LNLDLSNNDVIPDIFSKYFLIFEEDQIHCNKSNALVFNLILLLARAIFNIFHFIISLYSLAISNNANA